jgi:S-adenosylmethionine hydrolase
MRPVCLLTDFGLEDHYVGVLHALLERDAPGAARVDLGHGVRRGDVWTASHFLRCCWPHVPGDAVVLAVVDPGVGTARRPLAVAVGRRWVVAPDNGLAAAVGPPDDVIVLDWDLMGLPEPSATFHGRDLFAPAAAALARGDEPSTLGRRPADLELVPCPLPQPRHSGSRVHGVVAHIDGFGNVVTTIPAVQVLPGASVECGFSRITARVATYGDAEAGRPVMLAGSSGLLELAIREDSAAERLGLERGDPVVVMLPEAR